MVDYLDAHFEEFISLKKSKVRLYEFRSVEYINTLFEIFESKEITKNIPTCVWFIPNFRIGGLKYVVLIYKEIAWIV